MIARCSAPPALAERARGGALLQTTPSAKYLVMVCHTEPTWWDGSWQGFDEALVALREVWETAAGGEKRPLVTFCLTAEAIAAKAEVFRELQAAGHEIGVHSHLPGAHAAGRQHSYGGEFAYAVDRLGVLNQDAAARGIRAMAAAAGLGQARTHVSGMFTFRDTTIRVLEEAGFGIDCSLMPGELLTQEATGNVILADNRGRTCPAAYRVSREDHCAPGRSGIVELPVWGHLNSREDRECLLQIAGRSMGTGRSMAAMWEEYWRARGAFEGIVPSGSHVADSPEIVQVFFHYWDFLDHATGAVREDEMTAVGHFLQSWAELDNCAFATASAAAEAWSGRE